MHIKLSPIGLTSAEDPIGVEVVINGGTVQYKLCLKNRWSEPDCIPGILKRFWYISRESASHISKNISPQIEQYCDDCIQMHFISSDTNHLLYRQMVTVLYYESRYVILDGLDQPEDFTKEYPDIVKKIDMEYDSIMFDQIQFTSIDENFYRWTAPIYFANGS
jgi:hypothetical protein